MGTKAVINYFGHKFETVIPIPGYHMLYNAMAATCIGVHFGMSFDEIDKGIRKLKAIGGRNNMFEANGVTVIDDCYNANPMSMKASLEVLSHATGRKVAILGNMFELGAKELELHREVGETAGQLKIDLVITIGELAKEIHKGALAGAGQCLHFETKEEFLEQMDDIIKTGDTVLIKASNSMKFKEIVNKFQK